MDEKFRSEDSVKEPWHKGPLKIIIGLFLLLLMVMWLIPYYGIKQNPEPHNVPTLSELDEFGLNITGMTIPKINNSDIRSYVQTTPEIKQLADKIVTSSCKPLHKICNAKSLFYFVQNNFAYINDPLFLEYFKTPQESLKSSSGDCDDNAILLSSLLRSVGFQTRFVFVPRHVYVQVKIPEAITSYKDKEGWINLDATCKNCLFGEINYQYSESKKKYLG